MTIATEAERALPAHGSYERYRVSVREYVEFHEQGFLVVRGLIPAGDIQAMIEHTEDLLAGRVSVPGIVGLSDKLSPDEQIAHWTRAHMLHRILPIHEQFLLHPRTLDVLEALIGPDVLALQSMLFFKQPGQDGQGYHQDSYYIPSFPDTLCGAWVALERADEENGCMWMTVGSQHEPVYPDVHPRAGHNTLLGDIAAISGASSTDDERNGLTPVARRYAGREVKAEVDAGDVIFFGGHILHRSLRNRSATRSRRAFVGHYCNARSLVPWNHGAPYEGDSANYQHILGRGTTHLPYAQPRFGTPCAANRPAEQAAAAPGQPMSMMGGGDGMMGPAPHGDPDHD
jgi:hypothetical protein